MSAFKFFVAFIVFLLSLSYLSQGVYAADPTDLGFTTVYPIVDTEAVGGDIISITDDKLPTPHLGLSRTPYDTNMFGVIVTNPNILMRTADATGSPVLRDGQGVVNVTNLTGAISVGDFITSSQIPGKGQKAVELTAGYMLGVALSSFDGNSGTPITYEGKEYKMGTIKAAIGIGPASPIKVKAAGGVLGTLKQIVTAILYNIKTSKQLERYVRWILAALVAIITIYINFRTFGKNITKGIESIGRNPLAKVSIQGMIILNTIMIGLVSLGGIVLALVIISL